MFDKKINLYWLCQLLGWGSVALYWSYYQINNYVSTIVGLLSILVPFTLAIAYTHAYRNLAHSMGWINFPIRKLIPVLIFAWLSITLLYTSIAVLNSYFVYNSVGFDSFLGMITGGTRYAAIWLLAFHLYHFSQYRSRHELMQVKGEMLNLEAQYQILNSELNPHFLFNALNSIKALTIENPAKSRKAVDLLSDILRKSIHVSKFPKIKLSQELDRVNSYLELEQMRFEERLGFQLEIPDNLKSALLPPLSLLTLVENAVKHGIENNPNPSLIKILGKSDENNLILNVINNGTLGPENLNGVGLKNTKERLLILYETRASLSIQNYSHNQVLAKLKIPLEYE